MHPSTGVELASNPGYFDIRGNLCPWRPPNPQFLQLLIWRGAFREHQFLIVRS
jgi:hypothetical protein